MRRTVYSADHEAFRDTVRTFIERSILPIHEEIVAEKQIPDSVWLAAGKADLLGLEVPEEFGGSDPGDYRFNAVLGEELAKVSMAYNSCLQMHFDIGVPYFVKYGTQEQKERWLPGLCSGELVTTIAMTEPSGGSDLAALRTSAVRNGDDWVLNGSKTFITNGYTADVIIVAARTSPEKKAKGITLFALENGTPGFERGRKLDKVGQPEANTAELFFQDVRIPNANVIGEVDRGFIQMMEQLPQERISAAVGNLAQAKAILEETLVYAKERQAFGQSIGKFQHNKFLLADLFTQIDVSQAYVDACVVAHTQGDLTAVDAAKVKMWTSDIQNSVLDHCVQLHGGYGFMREYRVAQAWMDARVTRIWGGTNEIMKEIIGRDLGL
ncbi:MAG: acyl-CoA dehydrogenase family protein [Actinobacteria bacterium]|jgi:alkylation response protein AidB-like acyl-CoA dehydrogenase|nr:acyl-CoA dehydrogenase family protein [Actinomycetota bacterium]